MSEETFGELHNKAWRLIIEGKTDAAFVRKLWEMKWKKGLYPLTLPEMEVVNGVDNWAKPLHSMLSSQEIQNIGIILDADEGAAARLQGFHEIIKEERRKLKFTIISSPESPVGVKLELDTPSGSKRLYLWIMPDNQSPGMLEDFLLRTVHAGDVLIPEVDDAINRLEQKGKRLFSEPRKPKARLATWLAWQSSPGMSFTTAMLDHLIATDNELMRDFSRWLETLFDIKAEAPCK